jgi:subtilisin family serine protease
VAPDRPEFVDGQVVVQLEAWAEGDEVAQDYTMSILDEVPGRPVTLMQAPEGQSLDQLVATLEADPRVQFASPNFIVVTGEEGQTDATFNEGDFTSQDVVDQGVFIRLHLAEAQQLSTGQGVIVAVLDTGVDLDHPDLVGHLLPGYDFVDLDAFPDDAPNGLDDDLDGRVDEGTGHGTHVAGLVAAIAPDAMILPVRVLNSDGRGTLFQLLEGWYWALDQGADIINASLGVAVEVPELEAAVEQAVETWDCLVVAAAGATNADDEHHHWPSGFGESFSVTAVDSTDLKWSMANYGSKVDLASPGVGIIAPFVGGGYAAGTGTSMAAAIVSGAAALLRAYAPTLDAEEVGHRLQEYSVPIEAVNPQYELGEGRLDFLAPLGGQEPEDGQGGDEVGAPPGRGGLSGRTG